MLRLQHDQVNTLNRLYRLYNLAICNSKPYRISKLRHLYEAARASITIYTFSSSSYNEVLSADEVLDDITALKAIAIQQNNYEEASTLRDKENRRLNDLLSKKGISASDKFFSDEDRIYEKAFNL